MDIHVDLPLRPGPRPHTSNELPHSQLDQQPSGNSCATAVLETAMGWPAVHEAPSTIATEGSRALVLDLSAATGPAEAFLIGTEFCHLHAHGDHSMHATLPVPLAAAAESAGWAEPHYLVREGRAPATVVMLYAPRDDTESDVVLQLIRASYEFARTPAP